MDKFPLEVEGLNPRPGDLVDEREAAAILCTQIRTMRNWRALRKGPRYCKIGERMVRYHRADLAAFIAGESAPSHGNL